ncbi:hypothetical protein DUI87_19041 [Hirundo rustica rustica]|uniref:Uncharacterized protein n=1 Tax=Hirundo rustica rustica TaxID=333673 RepID=A0A3M0JT89_HIRRU|nr:hypothetical protein DUI87_19041 [Hirundo rustica rustica]
MKLIRVCTEYHKNQTKITPPVPRKAVITKMPAIPEVEEQITPVVTKIGPYAIKKTGVQKLIVNPKWSLKRVEMGVQASSRGKKGSFEPRLESFLQQNIQTHAPPRHRNRLQLTEGLHLKDDNWNFVSVDNSEQGTWPRVKGKLIVVGDCKHTPKEIEILPGTLDNNPGKFVLWLRCTHPPTFLPKGQTVAQIIPTWEHLEEDNIPTACPVHNITEVKPQVGWEKTLDAIKHLIQAFSFMGIPKELKTDNGPAYRSKEFCSFLQQWGVGHKTGIPHSPTGQAVVERTHREIKRVLNQQQPVLKTETPQTDPIGQGSIHFEFLNSTFEFLNPPIVRHFGANPQLNIKERPPVMVRDPETGRTEGPHDLVTWGRGYACVSTPTGPRWLPSKWVEDMRLLITLKIKQCRILNAIVTRKRITRYNKIVLTIEVYHPALAKCPGLLQRWQMMCCSWSDDIGCFLAPGAAAATGFGCVSPGFLQMH